MVKVILNKAIGCYAPPLAFEAVEGAAVSFETPAQFLVFHGLHGKDYKPADDLSAKTIEAWLADAPAPVEDKMETTRKKKG